MAAKERIFSLGPLVRLFLFVFEPLLDAVANLITSFTQDFCEVAISPVVFLFSGNLTVARVARRRVFLLWSLRVSHAYVNSL